MFVQPLLQWKSNKYYIFWACICSLMHPVFNVYAPCYLVIRELVWLFHIFLHYLTTSTIFGTRVLNVKCVLFSLQISFVTFPTPRSTEQDTVINVHRTYYKVPVILLWFSWSLNFLSRFLKNTQISNSIKIHPVCAVLFHADGRMDGHSKANSRFLQFCKRA
jgi:hypothetical protein